MKLYTGCILSKRRPDDGVRISVMARHTLNDGIAPDLRIIEGISFDEWNKELAPPGKLVGSYYRNEISWEEYELSYRHYLQHEGKDELLKLAKRALREPITLLCIEKEPSHCHRRLLAEELAKIERGLEVICR